MPLRVVVDPGVWVSAILNPGGGPAAILATLVRGEIEVVASPHLLDELAGVLARDKFRRWCTLEQVEAFVTQLAHRTELHTDIPNPPKLTRDPKDDYLAALAQATNATVVSGDADLLEANLDPPALTPRQLLDQISRG